MLTSTVATLHDNSTHGEDSYLVRTLDNNALLDAVMDGVTGRKGREASRALADALATAVLTSPDDVVAVLETMNQKLYQRGWGRFWLTTVSAVLFLGDTLHVIGVGDSPVFLLRSDSCQALFCHVSGLLHAGVARALGARQTLGSLYHTAVTVAPGDRVVLATDGVTDNMTRPELVDIVRHAASPNTAAEQLHTLLTTRHQQGQWRGDFRRDDWTAIIRFFSLAG